jgi:5-methylcytosine-specific restriction endonuclease McrA
MTIVEPRTKKPRDQMVAELIARDGTTCQYPGCGNELDFSVVDGPKEVTIDHWVPQSWGFENGWTYEMVWDTSNLKLMEKKCNAKKGDLLPNKDGTLPEKAVRTFKYRRDARAQRPEICNACNNGRNLEYDEVCAACNSGPMPLRWERWRKMAPKDCDHALFWCPMCGSGVIPRAGATEMILIEGEGGED